MSGGLNKTILLIEGDTGIALAEKLKLEAEGYRVVTIEPDARVLEAIGRSDDAIVVSSLDAVCNLLRDTNRVRDNDILFQSVLDSIQDGISVLEPDLTIRHVNNVMERWYPQDGSLQGLKCHNVYHFRDEPCTSCPSIRALQSGNVEQEEVPGRSDASVEWLEVFAYPMKDPDTGEITGVVEFVRDISERKRLERQLRESEEKHRRLFETMTQGVVYQAADGAIISANPAAEEILGITLDQMLGKTSMDPRWQMITEEGVPIPGEDHPAMVALRTGAVVGPVTRGVFHPDKNTHIWLSITATPLYRPGEDTPYQVYATMSDITDRKNSEQLHRILFQKSPEAIYLHDLDGRITDVNEEAERQSGYTRGELLTMEIFDLHLHKQDRETIRRHWIDYRTGERYTLQHQHRRKDGTTFPVEISTGVISFRNGKALLAECRDVSERVQAEEALRTSEARWKFALEGSDAGVWDWNIEQDQVYISARWKTMLGYREHELTNAKDQWKSRLHPDDADRTLDALQRHLSGETDLYICETRLRCKNGTYKWVLDRGKVVARAPDGSPLRIIGTQTDITERKNTETQVLKLMQEKDILLRETNHRIKNNFATVESLLSLQSQRVTTPEATRMLNDVRSQVAGIWTLYDRLLHTGKFTHVNIGPYLLELSERVFDANPTCEQVSLVTDITDMDLDTNRSFPVGAILVELMTNSLKYAFDGSCSRPGAITVTLRREAERGVLTISDDGNGLPDGFDPETTTSFGLVLVRMMAEQIDGTFRIESSPGGGTRGSVEFPL